MSGENASKTPSTRDDNGRSETLSSVSRSGAGPVSSDSERERFDSRPTDSAHLPDSHANVELGASRAQSISGEVASISEEVCPSTLPSISSGEVHMLRPQMRDHSTSDPNVAFSTASSGSRSIKELASAAASNKGDVHLGDVDWNALPTNVGLYKSVMGESPGDQENQPKFSNTQSSQSLNLDEPPALLSSDDDSLPPNKFYPESDSGSSARSLTSSTDIGQLYAMVLKSWKLYHFIAQKIVSGSQITLLVKTDEDNCECIDLDERHREMLEMLEADDMIKDVNQFSAPSLISSSESDTKILSPKIAPPRQPMALDDRVLMDSETPNLHLMIRSSRDVWHFVPIFQKNDEELLVIVKVGPDTLSKITCLEADMPLLKQAIKLGQLRRTRDGIDYSQLDEVEIEIEHQKWLNEASSPSQSEHDVSKETVIFRPHIESSIAVPQSSRLDNDGVEMDTSESELTNVSSLAENESTNMNQSANVPDLDTSSMEVQYDDSERNITYSDSGVDSSQIESDTSRSSVSGRVNERQLGRKPVVTSFLPETGPSDTDSSTTSKYFQTTSAPIQPSRPATPRLIGEAAIQKQTENFERIMREIDDEMTPIRQEVKRVLELSKSQEKLYAEKKSRRTPPGYEYSRNMTASPYINPHLQRTASITQSETQVAIQAPAAASDTTPGSIIQPQLSCGHTAEEAPYCRLKVTTHSFRPIDVPASTNLPLKSIPAIKTPIPITKVQSQTESRAEESVKMKLTSPPPISRVISQRELQKGVPKIPTTHSRIPSPQDNLSKTLEKPTRVATTTITPRRSSLAVPSTSALVTPVRPSPIPRQSIATKLAGKLKQNEQSKHEREYTSESVVSTTSLQRSRPAVQQDAIPAVRATAPRVNAATELPAKTTVSHHDDSQSVPGLDSTSQLILFPPTPSDIDAQQRVAYYQSLHRKLDKEYHEFENYEQKVAHDRERRLYVLQRHLNRVRDEIERCGYVAIHCEPPAEPIGLSEKAQEALQEAQTDQEINELRAALANTDNPAVEVARLEHTFAERRYQTKVKQLEQKKAYDQKIIDLLVKQIEQNRELLQVIYKIEEDSHSSTSSPVQTTSPSKTTQASSPLPINTQVITPHITIQEVKSSEMPAGQDNIPQYVSTPVATSKVVSSAPPSVITSKVSMPTDINLPGIGTSPSRIEVAPGQVPIISSSPIQPRSTQHSTEPQVEDRPPSQKSVDTQTAEPPVHRSIQTESESDHISRVSPRQRDSTLRYEKDNSPVVPANTTANEQYIESTDSVRLQIPVSSSDTSDDETSMDESVPQYDGPTDTKTSKSSSDRDDEKIMRDLGHYLQRLVGPSQASPLQETVKEFVSRVKEEAKKRHDTPPKTTSQRTSGKVEKKKIRSKKKVKKSSQQFVTQPDPDFSPSHDSTNPEDSSDDGHKRKKTSPKKEPKKAPESHSSQKKKSHKKRPPSEERPPPEESEYTSSSSEEEVDPEPPRKPRKDDSDDDSSDGGRDRRSRSPKKSGSPKKSSHRQDSPPRKRSLNELGKHCPVKLSTFDPDKTDCQAWLSKFHSYIRMRDLTDREAINIVKFYVTDDVNIWLEQTTYPGMTLKAFEKAFREEYGISELAVPTQKAKLWNTKPKRGDYKAFIDKAIKTYRDLKKIRTGRHFTWSQEQELLEIIKNGLPAHVRSYAHTHGDSTLEELRRSVKDKQAMGWDEGNIYAMEDKMQAFSNESLENAIAPLTQRLEEISAKTDAVQQEQKALTVSVSHKTTKTRNDDSDFHSMCDRVANTLAKRATKKTSKTSEPVDMIDVVPAPNLNANPNKPLMSCYRCKSTEHLIRQCPLPPTQEELDRRARRLAAKQAQEAQERKASAMTHQAQQKQVMICQICKLQGHTADQHIGSDGTIREPKVFTNYRPKPKVPTYAAVVAAQRQEPAVNTITKTAAPSSSSSE